MPRRATNIVYATDNKIMKMPRKATIIVHIINQNNEDTHESHNHSKFMNVLLKMSKKKYKHNKIHIDEFR